MICAKGGGLASSNEIFTVGCSIVEVTGRVLPNFCSLEPNKKIGFQISSFFVQNLLFVRFCHYKYSYLKHN